MFLRRYFSKNRNAEVDRSSLGEDRSPTYASNITTAPSYTLPGRDYVRQSDETESSLSDTIGVAEKSKVATTNYSKRLPVSGSSPNSHSCEFVSILYYLRRGRSYSFKGTCCCWWSFSRAHQSYLCAAPSHRQNCKMQHCKSREHQRRWKHKSLPYTIQSITYGRRSQGCYPHSYWYWPRIHATGTPSAGCKDVRLRTKRLGVRWEGWTCEFCRAWYNVFRDPIWYVHLVTLLFSFSLMFF